jgi:hypothetical protein
MCGYKTIKSRLRKTRVILLVLGQMIAFSYGFTAREPASETVADAQLEMGIDSLQQKYLRPIFRYDFPLPDFTLFGEVMFHQRAGDQLRGAIDFWLSLGMRRNFSGNFSGEIRLNHMCRHLSCRENPDILNLNEVLARGWYRGKGFRFGLGYGIYTGGNLDYSFLLILNSEFPNIFGTELSFVGEIKSRDFTELLYELELSFALDKSTELFIRNSKYYQFENTTFIGIRMKAAGQFHSYLDSLKLSTGFYTHYENHKILVEGQFRMAFFKTEWRRLNFTLDFMAPIIRNHGFWGDFYPENMVYGFCLEYERTVNSGLFLSWYGRYNLDIPLDIGERFFSDLGTGIRLKNQTDFDRLDKAIRFELSAGYNFSYDYDLDAKLGFNLLELKRVRCDTDCHVRLNNTRFYSGFSIFAELGKTLSVRPFIRFDISDNHTVEALAEVKFLVGVKLLKWYDR